MEALLPDMRRALHSFLSTMSTILGKSMHGADSPAKKARSYRAIGNAQAMRDIYGQAGKVDIHSSKEMVKFYRGMSFGKDKPL